MPERLPGDKNYGPVPQKLTKICERCGKEYPRPRYSNGHLQSTTTWKRRKYCSKKCQHDATIVHTDTKVCQRPGCDKTFSRPIGKRNPGKETPKEFEKRKYCSSKCSALSKSSPEVIDVAFSIRYCGNPECGLRLVKKDWERLRVFARRKYCNESCKRSRKMGPETQYDKYCKYSKCGEKLFRRRDESHASFEGRKYCCRNHMTLDRQENSVGFNSQFVMKNRNRIRRTPTQITKGLSVFGDKKPDEVWRPSAWRK